MRSLLIAPADRTDGLVRALESGADAVVVDLQTVIPARRSVAHAALRAFLSEARERSPRPRLMALLPPLDDPDCEAALDAFGAALPDAIVLSHSAGGGDVQRMSVKLAVREAEAGAEDGSVGVLSIAANGAALFALGSYRGASSRLLGLGWRATPWARDLGAGEPRLSDGRFIEPLQLARNLIVHAASAAKVAAFDSPFPWNGDPAALRRECEVARSCGFRGKFVTHVDHVAIINKSFLNEKA